MTKIAYRCKQTFDGYSAYKPPTPSPSAFPTNLLATTLNILPQTKKKLEREADQSISPEWFNCN